MPANSRWDLIRRLGVKDAPRAATLVAYRVVLQDIWLYRDPNGDLPTRFHKTQVLQHRRYSYCKDGVK